MTEPIHSTLSSPAAQMFPTLTPAQIARIAAHGSVRQVRQGEVLFEAGDQVVPFFVVIARAARGRPPFRRRRDARHHPWTGQFTGEVNMLSGAARSCGRARPRRAR